MTSAFATLLRAVDPMVTSDIASSHARSVPGDLAGEFPSRPVIRPTRTTVMVSTLVVLLLIAICAPASLVANANA